MYRRLTQFLNEVIYSLNNLESRKQFIANLKIIKKNKHEIRKERSRFYTTQSITKANINQSIDLSTNPLIYPPIHWSIDQSIDPQTNPLIHQPSNWSIYQSIDPSTNQLFHQPINCSINQSIVPSTNRLFHQPINCSINQSIGPSTNPLINNIHFQFQTITKTFFDLFNIS